MPSSGKKSESWTSDTATCLTTWRSDRHTMSFLCVLHVWIQCTNVYVLWEKQSNFGMQIEILHTFFPSQGCRSMSVVTSLAHPVRQPFAGQVELEAPGWMSIVSISYEAWTKVPPRVFQAAWISCGYMKWEDMPTDPVQPPITLADARTVLDVFGKLGGGSPQRCTVCEWQIQV